MNFFVRKYKELKDKSDKRKLDKKIQLIKKLAKERNNGVYTIK